MIITSTLKISIGATVAICLISIGNYILNEKTEFQPTENKTLVVNPVENEALDERLNETNLIQQPLVITPPPAPIEMPEPVEVVYDIVVFAENFTGQTVTRDEIRSITSCGFTSCNGCCGVYHMPERIEEQPIEEEDESLLSEQIFADPYVFEAKTYPNPTRENATVELDIEVGGNFTIQLFDLNGRLIQQIYDGELESGRQSFNVDLYDNMPGLYFINIQSLFQQETLKIQKI